MRRISTSVTITDPLVKYQSLMATGIYSPDPAQHRLAIHLQKVYHRLKDYSPSVKYQARLKAISRALDRSKTQDRVGFLAVESHPIRRNPLFSRFFARTEGPDTLALTRALTSHEEAINADSPQGLFLSGEVGTGKSMFLDLLADGLPTTRKRRWHFNTFMLYTFRQLEHHRKSHSRLETDDQQYSLLWMAKEMIAKSPVLFLDEFQLPDKAASKILSNLLTAFFQLGGVLVASSNRMPDELEKAAGFDYTSSTTHGRVGRLLGLRKTRGKGGLYGSSSDFAAFLEVLKARCEFWQMEGARDWRRHEAGELLNRYTSSLPDAIASQSPLTFNSISQVASSTGPTESSDSADEIKTPRYFYLIHETDETSWAKSLDLLLPFPIKKTPWESTTLTVYGRAIVVPQHHKGIVYWNFPDLVSSFGPADYISMASTFHTFIIDGIPTLTVLKKNEARRLITLLDALYEARCKLVVRAEAGPDDLFFPEARHAPPPPSSSSSSSSSPSPQHLEGEPVVDADAIHSETIAEAYQDAQSPFRPNISSYGGDSATYDPDHDFGSDFGLGPGSGSAGQQQQQQQQHQQRQKQEQGPGVDFGNTAAFTGEDERFAYKRAASRLWELCGARWHARGGGGGDGWWRPLPPEARHWEGRGRGPSCVSGPEGAGRKKEKAKDARRRAGGEEVMGPAVDLDEPAGLQRLRVEHLRRAAAGAGEE